MKENRLIYVAPSTGGESPLPAVPVAPAAVTPVVPVTPEVPKKVEDLNANEKTKILNNTSGQLKGFKEALEKSQKKDDLYEAMASSVRGLIVFPSSEDGFKSDMESLGRDNRLWLAAAAMSVDWNAISDLTIDLALKQLLGVENNRVGLLVTSFISEIFESTKEGFKSGKVSSNTKFYEMGYSKVTHKIELKFYTEQESTVRRAELQAEVQKAGTVVGQKEAETPNAATPEELQVKENAAALAKSPIASLIFGAFGIVGTQRKTAEDGSFLETKEEHSKRVIEEYEALLSGGGKFSGAIACFFLGIPVANSNAETLLGVIPEKQRGGVEKFLKSGHELAESTGITKLLNLLTAEPKIFEKIQNAETGGKKGVMTLANKTKIIDTEALIPSGKRLTVFIPPKASIDLKKKEREFLAVTDKASGKRDRFSSGSISGGEAGRTFVVEAGNGQSFGKDTVFDKGVTFELVDLAPSNAGEKKEAMAPGVSSATAKPETASASMATKAPGTVQENPSEVPSA